MNRKKLLSICLLIASIFVLMTGCGTDQKAEETDSAVQHDFDVEPIGFKRGEIPYTGKISFEADEDMRRSAVEAIKEVVSDVKYFEGRICSGDQFIDTNEKKAAITSKFGGMCCEMEGAAIAQTCYLNNTPFVIIRAISDKEDGSASLEYEVFQKAAAEHCAKIVEYMVEKKL